MERDPGVELLTERARAGGKRRLLFGVEFDIEKFLDGRVGERTDQFPVSVSKRVLLDAGLRLGAEEKVLARDG